jgi:hypothetical protein
MRYSTTVLALCIGLVSTALASAAFTPIFDSPDEHNEPNLLGINPFLGNPNPSVLETLYGESNLRRVDDSFDHAFRHTGSQASVKAVARFNNPSILDRIAFYKPSTDSWQTVLEFQRNLVNSQFPVGYVLPTLGTGLIPRADSGPVFELRSRAQITSNPSKNPSGHDVLVTFEIIGNEGRPSNQIGNYVLAWEIFPTNDLDYQDNVFELNGAVPVPEPTVWSLIISAILGVMCQRRIP